MALLDWNSSSYTEIMDLSFMDGDYFNFYNGFNSEHNKYKKSYFSLLGIENGYAYYISVGSDSEKNRQFWQISINEFTVQESIEYNYSFPDAVCIHKGKLYTIGKLYSTNELLGKIDVYYNVIDFNYGQIIENIIDTGYDNRYNYSDFTLNFFDANIVISTSDGIFKIDNQNIVTQISADDGTYLCVINNKIYYYSDGMYCRINTDGSGWEKITLNDFE